MSELDDPIIDELRNIEGSLLGKSPVQRWRAPVSVSSREPTPPELLPSPPEVPRPTFADLIQGKAKVKFYRKGVILDFVVSTPWADPPSAAGYVKPSELIFERFLDLDSASDSEICSFASKFGPLAIFCHTETTDKNTELIREYSEVWRYFAGCMRACLHIAVNFYAKRSQDPSDWDVIGNCPRPVSYAKYRITDADVLDPLQFRPEEAWSARACFISQGEHRDRDMLVRLLNGLLMLGRARPCVLADARTRQLKMVFSAPSLLSYLALQLCLTALKKETFELCSVCQRQYFPQRAAKSGQRNYCPECRKAGEPGKFAKRRERERKRASGS